MSCAQQWLNRLGGSAQAYNGHRIKLVPQIMGNLDSKEVSADEFSELVPEGMSGSEQATQ